MNKIKNCLLQNPLWFVFSVLLWEYPIRRRKVTTFFLYMQVFLHFFLFYVE